MTHSLVVMDAGRVINPHAATEQCEGSVVWELSHAWTGGLQLEGGQAMKLSPLNEIGTTIRTGASRKVSMAPVTGSLTTTRSGGRRKNAVARTAFRAINTNNFSRQIAMPCLRVTRMVS